ncbi:hypothetical protein LZC95_08340 [Pendulispora brunnea]|uniref:Tetratricopeptide repeat protein n=1 Tax=Pendulispora brunnea TaxID=2905690 RepID=A0ABZ2KFK5_9BACT
MRELLDQLTDRLRSFIVKEDDKVVLVVEVVDAANGLVAKTVDLLDDEIRDAVWLFVDGYATPVDFADRIAQRVYERRERACKLLEQAKEPLWPPIPLQVFDRNAPPVARVRASMVYARSLAPNPDAVRVVWGLFPGHIGDPVSYRAFILELLAHEFPAPWCHHLRVLVRDDSARPALADADRQLPGTATYTPRLSPEAFEAEVEDHASDRNRPIDERMPSVLTLAGLDLAHKRFPEAIAKYKLAARYYGGIGNLALYALALNGIGEVHARAERANEALAYFESALTPAFQRLEQTDNPGRVDAVPILLNIALNLGNLYLTQQRWAEAGAYYEAAKGMAHGMAHTQVEIQCFENIGVCHYQLGQHVEAIRAWDAGSALARTFEAFEHLHNLLVRRRDAYYALHMSERYEATVAEIHQLDAYLARARKAS